MFVCLYHFSFFSFAFSRPRYFRVGLFLQPTAHRPILSLGVEAIWLGRHCETGALSLLEQMTCKPHQIIKFPLRPQQPPKQPPQQPPPAKGVSISASVMRLCLLLVLYQQDPSLHRSRLLHY